MGEDRKIVSVTRQSGTPQATWGTSTIFNPEHNDGSTWGEGGCGPPLF